METEVVKWSLDPNWIMAIIAIVAIISPIATAIINNLHQSKMKQLEMYDLAKRQALSDYIETSLLVANQKTPQNETNFYISLHKLYMYFPELSHISYDKLSEIHEGSALQSYFSRSLIANLSEQIQKK